MKKHIEVCYSLPEETIIEIEIIQLMEAGENIKILKYQNLKWLRMLLFIALIYL